MAILDSAVMFHEDTAVTTATEYKGDSVKINQGEKGVTAGTMAFIQPGEPVEIVVQVTETFAGGTSCEFELVTGDVAALTNDVTHHTSGAILTANLTAGTTFVFPITMTAVDADATHLGVMATSVGVHTAGAFSAWAARAGEYQSTITDLNVDLQD